MSTYQPRLQHICVSALINAFVALSSTRRKKGSHLLKASGGMPQELRE
jgi:hypothetical protein